MGALAASEMTPYPTPKMTEGPLLPAPKAAPTPTPSGPCPPAGPSPGPTVIPLPTPVAGMLAPPFATQLAPSGPVSLDSVSPTSANSVLYMIKATVRPFNPAVIPPLARPAGFNDDLALGPFRPSKYVWAGEQRRGVAMHISDAVSIEDHVMKSLGLEFFLANDIPLPPEMETAMDQTISTPYRPRWNSGENKWAESKKW